MSRVLVVDDDADIRHALEDMLTIAGHEVCALADGPSALALADSEIPDLILLDIMMPGMDGFEVCSRLRENEDFDGVPIVMLTALRESNHRIQGLKAGADDFISKPCGMEELLARVHSALRLRRLIVELQRQRLESLVLSGELIRTEARLRTEVATDIHDTLMQALVGIDMWLESLSLTGELSADRIEELSVLRRATEDAIVSGRTLIRGLRPELTTVGSVVSGLCSVVDSLTVGTELEVECAMSDDLGPISHESEVALLRMTQEVVRNVLRHADATKLRVTAAEQGAGIAVTIEDDGIGIDVEAAEAGPLTGHFGLAGVKAQAGMVGGYVTIDSPGTGTKVTLWVPREAEYPSAATTGPADNR